VRAVIDTNLWISFLFGKKTADLLALDPFRSVRILNYRGFKAMFEEE